MARHIFIAGVDRWEEYERDSLDIEQVLTYQIDTCSFVVKGEKPNEGDEVIVEDDNIGRLFAGIVTKPELSRFFRQSGFNTWAITCDDYSVKVDKYLVVETYRNMAADAIFRDIVAKYCPSFTVNGVRTGAPTVEEIIFDYKYPSECFKELCNYIGWHWMVDYYKDLQFFSAELLAQPAPLTLTPGARFTNIKHSIDTQGLRNRVYVKGGTMLSDFFTYEVKADGAARIWTLPHRPHEISMKVNGVPVSVGIENVHEEADYAYLMNFEEKFVRTSEQTATIAAGTTISFTYKFDIDVITTVEDVESQNAIADVQGGDGIYEYVITDDNLTTIEAAEAAGLADLREHANPKVKGSFETHVPGWQPGQIVNINLPDRGIVGQFLVQKVRISPAIDDYWIYQIEYGGRLIGIADFLKALVSAQQKKQSNETALLHKFSYGMEKLKIVDELQLTSRSLGWKCGDVDAICGFVECG